MSNQIINENNNENDYEVIDNIANYHMINLIYSPFLKGVHYFFEKIYKSLHIDFEMVLNKDHIIPSDILLTKTSLSLVSTTPVYPFVKNLLKSYKDDDDLSNQFIMDIERSRLYINGNKVDNPNKALFFLEESLGLISNYVKVCCTQTICAPLFEWITKSLPESYFLSETKGHCRLKKSLIEIKGTSFTYSKQLRIFKLHESTDETLNNLYIKIYINCIKDLDGDVFIEIINIPE